MAPTYSKFPKRKRRKKGSTYVSKATAIGKTGAKAQSKQITTLQRQINRINTKVHLNKQWVQHRRPIDPTKITHATEPGVVTFTMIAPAAWDDLFSSAHDDDGNKQKKYQMRSMGIEFLLTMENPTDHPDPVDYSIFLVSVRKKTANAVLRRTTNLTHLEEGKDFSRTSLSTAVGGQGDGLILLNKSIYKIHALFKGAIGHNTLFQGVEGTKTTNLADNRFRKYFSLDWPITLNAGINQDGWKHLEATDIPDEHQLYLMVFTNNYAGQTMHFAGQAIFTGQVTN